ncbi:MAG: LysM peptidoglycan-binding domain-containing protein [Mariniblastus sp.]|nr:LysM peptidoglycan-binding domain-containing protein [Mariniblastus sp.]
MNDPFNTQSVNRQLMREAKIGFAVVLLLAGFFVYVGYFRMGKFQANLPAHILAAPVATNVGQEYYENFFPPENPGQRLANSTKPAGTGKRAVATTNPPPIVVESEAEPETEMTVKSPFQLPSAILQTGKNMGEALAGSANTGEQVTQTEPTSEMSPALRVADVTAGQGTIPTSKLRSENPNQQTEFDIATSGPGGKPEPFAGSDLRSLEPKSSQGSADQGSPAGSSAPEARTAREISVNEKDQSQVQPLPQPDLLGHPEPMPLPSPFDNSNAGSSIAKTETLNTRQGVPSSSAKPVPLAFAKPDLEQTPIPDNNVSTHANGNQSGDSYLGEFEKHVVQAGETYWSIAQMYFQDGRLFRALFEHNRPRNAKFEDLPTGSHVEIPTSDHLIKHYPNHVPSDLKRHDASPHRSQPGDWYVTKQGETLFEIAKEKYGQASRYLDILDSNRDKLPVKVQHMTRLQSGLRLFLPN